jgi:hypothetical protein
MAEVDEEVIPPQAPVEPEADSGQILPDDIANTEAVEAPVDVVEAPVEVVEDEETKRLRLEREEIERKEREEREERERIAREEAEAKLKEELAKFGEVMKGGISTIGKTADGSSYAYLKMILAVFAVNALFRKKNWREYTIQSDSIGI